MRPRDEFGVQTDEHHLRALRHALINARKMVYSLDEGDTVDKNFESFIGGDGMHPRVRVLLEGLDQAIMQTAYMIDELDTETSRR